MTQVHPNLEDYVEDPTEGNSVDLIVGLGEMSIDELTDRLDDFDAEYLRELSFGFHLISAPEREVSDICGMSGIETVEADEGMEDFGEGKSQDPLVSNR